MLYSLAWRPSSRATLLPAAPPAGAAQQADTSQHASSCRPWASTPAVASRAPSGDRSRHCVPPAWPAWQGREAGKRPVPGVPIRQTLQRSSCPAPALAGLAWLCVTETHLARLPDSAPACSPTDGWQRRQRQRRPLPQLKPAGAVSTQRQRTHRPGVPLQVALLASQRLHADNRGSPLQRRSRGVFPRWRGPTAGYLGGGQRRR
jgi:hypothetical protein